MSDPFRLDGKVAVITGGATGLGFGMAKEFIEAGARVVLVARREGILHDSAARLGEAASFIVHDVTSGDAVPLVAEVTDRFGRVDVLVNNAGVHDKRPFLDTSLADFERVLRTHVFGAFSMSRALAPLMTEGGHILFITSMSAYIGMPLIVAYSAAKAAYVGMIHSLATELAGARIRVNGIAPGWIESEMLHRALDSDPERRAKILGRTPLGRFGEPSDIGHAAVYLSSEAARFITGVILPVDGGALMGF